MSSAANFAKNRNLLLSPSKSAVIGKPFLQLSAVDSTNNYAMAQIHNGLATHGTTWFTDVQTAGKGQRGKQWEAAAGQSILQTTAIEANAFRLSNPFELTVLVANACYELFSKYAGDETCIKWPNDIYWRDRKAGGILIENVIRGSQWSWAVIGVGLNINQTSFAGLPNPVSLKQITGKEFEVVPLGQELCALLELQYQRFLKDGFEDLYEQYLLHLYRRGRAARLKFGDEIHTCTIEGVNRSGDLQVSGCGRESFRFGEVEWVIS